MSDEKADAPEASTDEVKADSESETVDATEDAEEEGEGESEGEPEEPSAA